MPKKPAKRKSPVSRKDVNYSKNWLKWVVIYFLLGSLVYLSIYALFFQKSYSDFKTSTSQNTP